MISQLAERGLRLTDWCGFGMDHAVAEADGG